MSSTTIEREFQKGKIIFAAPDSLKPILLDVTKISQWGSKAVSVCVVTNGLDANQVGVSRRAVLSPNSGKYAHRVVSETLVAVRNSPLKTFVTFSLTEPMIQKKVAQSETLKNEQAELLKRASMSENSSLAAPQRVTEQVNNSDNNKSSSARAPPPNPSDAVPGALYLDTTVSLSPVDSDPEKSFVEIFIEYAASDAMKADEIKFFLEKHWVGPLLDSLADYALNISFPVQQGRTDMQFRKLYERHEETVVRICAKKHIDEDLKERSEALLDALYASYRDTVAAQAQTENTKNELYSNQVLLREATSKIAELEAELNTVQSKLLIAEHAGTNPNNSNNNSNDEEASRSNSQQQQQQSTAASDSSHHQHAIIQASPHQTTSQTATDTQQQSTQHTQTSSVAAPSPLRGGLASDKAAYTATPDQRSRQVLSAIPDFGVTTTTTSTTTRPNVYKLFNSPLDLGGQAGREAEEASLRAKFQALDVDRQGYLTVGHVCQLLAAIDPSDDADVADRLKRERTEVTPRRRGPANECVKAELENPNRSAREKVHYREAMDWCVRHCRDKSGKRVSFDEFAVLMCQLERAI